MVAWQAQDVGGCPWAEIGANDLITMKKMKNTRDRGRQ